MPLLAEDGGDVDGGGCCRDGRVVEEEAEGVGVETAVADYHNNR